MRVTNTTESPYLIEKNTQIAEFSVVTPEQSKHIKPVDRVILSTVLQGDPDLTGHLSELLSMNKPGKQDNTLWCRTPENPGKSQDHTPIQTRILKEIIQIKEKEKLYPEESNESRNKIPKQFYWTNSLLTETEKQGNQDILVDYLVFLRVRKFHICTKEAQRKLTSPCGSPESQQSDCR